MPGQEINNTPLGPNLQFLNDIFRVDFNSIPGHAFEKGEEGENKSGDRFTPYHKKLEPKACNIFEQLDIKLFEQSGDKTIIFTCHSFDEKDIEHIKTLTNELFSMYGKDSAGLGEFTSYDERSLTTEFWTGRLWTSDQYNYPSMMFYNEKSGLSITFWIGEKTKNSR